MRTTLATLAAAASLSCLSPIAAHAQLPPNLLQQLLPGSQGQGQTPNANVEQAVREAYERGYRQGRQDQERSDNERGRAPAPGYQQPGYQQPSQNYQRNQYGR